MDIIGIDVTLVNARFMGRIVTGQWRPLYVLHTQVWCTFHKSTIVLRLFSSNLIDLLLFCYIVISLLCFYRFFMRNKI
jgi:hypothetical protein